MSFILLSFGIAVPVVLWVVVGFHVGLQDSARELAWLSISCYYVIIIYLETCNVAWQQTRDDLILLSLNFSIVSIFLLVLASATLFCEQPMFACGVLDISYVYVHCFSSEPYK